MLQFLFSILYSPRHSGKSLLPIISLLVFQNCGISLAVIFVHEVVGNKTTERFNDEDSTFGPRVSDELPLSGYLYAAIPLNGCVHSLPRPANASKHAIPFISLIKRGECSFDDKVRAAERGGFAGAIVYNHLDNTIFPMGSESSLPVRIPSFMIGLKDGIRFLEKYTLPYENYIIEITRNHKVGYEVYLIPVVTVVGLFLFGVVGAFIYRWNEQRRQERHRCLTSSQLSNLPITKFVKGQSEEGSCVVCIEEYEDGDKIRTLPCGHSYHSNCIDPWLLKRNRTCPICKRSACPDGPRSRSLLAYFRRRSNRTETTYRIVYYARSSDNRENGDNRIEHSVITNPGTSYGTIEPPQQAIRKFISRSLDETTPLLSGRSERPVIQSWPSAPSSLNLVTSSPEPSRLKASVFDVPSVQYDPSRNSAARGSSDEPSQCTLISRSPDSSATLIRVPPCDIQIHHHDESVDV